VKIRVVALLTAVLALTGAGVASAGSATAPATKKGAPAPAGVVTDNLGAYSIATGPTWRLPPFGFGSSTATCPAGLVPTGGGESNSSAGNLVLTDSYPTGVNSWTVYVKNLANEIQSFTGYAICGS
jgi:hypothetical protein